VSGAKKPANAGKNMAKNQISPDLDKYETNKIERNKNKN
jgi:hypothetical protein